MRLLGIDYGTKRIGIALSDAGGDFAFPHSVVPNCPARKCVEESVTQIKKICGEEGVEKIILGKSIDYKGQPNPVMAKIEPFKAVLEKEIGLPVIYQEETLTTKEAGRLPSTGDARGFLSNPKIIKGRRGRIKKIDASAATLILRSYIEKQKVVK